MVLRGRAIEVEDDDHGTGSTIMVGCYNEQNCVGKLASSRNV